MNVEPLKQPDNMGNNFLHTIDDEILSLLQAQAVVRTARPPYSAVAQVYRRQQGLTLIEIMIALLLGAFLLGGVMGIFLNSKQTYRVQDALSRLQENGRFAMDFLVKDIRMTDYRECQTGLTPLSPLVQSAAAVVNGVTISPGQNIALDPNLNLTFDGAPNANRALDAPDGITVRWSTRGCNPYNPLAPNDPTTESSGNNRSYDVVGGNLRLATQNLIEGVENMQILYGVDTDITAVKPNGDGIANYYVPGSPANFPAGADWARVVSVRVSLLLRTIEDNIASTQLSYTYNGGTTLATDRRIRRVFSSTIALRNRIRGG